MRQFYSSAIGLLSLVAVSAMAQNGAPNTLTPAEKAAGWTLLFDGRSLPAWRGFKSGAPPAGWKAVDGMVVREASGGDLMTRDQYGDFELRLEWKVSKAGNSGVMFHITNEGAETYQTGPEMQILDNSGHPDGQNPMTSAGSNYALHAPVPTRPGLSASGTRRGWWSRERTSSTG